MKNGKLIGFIPFGVDMGDGTVISEDCKWTFAPGITVIESHRDEKGIMVITNIRIDEVSAIIETNPKSNT